MMYMCTAIPAKGSDLVTCINSQTCVYIFIELPNHSDPSLNKLTDFVGTRLYQRTKLTEHQLCGPNLQKERKLITGLERKKFISNACHHANSSQMHATKTSVLTQKLNAASVIINKMIRSMTLICIITTFTVIVWIFLLSLRQLCCSLYVGGLFESIVSCFCFVFVFLTPELFL